MTRRSLSEISATARKAARGAGCEWGLADDAARAVRLCEAHGLQGAEMLAELLASDRSCRCGGGAAGAPACAIAVLADLSDRPPATTGAVRDLGPVVGAPLLAGMLLDVAAETGLCFELAWPEGRIVVMADGLSARGEIGDGDVRLTVVELVPPAGALVRPDHDGRDVTDDAWRTLEALVARTHVPESDVSRARGAGPDQTEDSD